MNQDQITRILDGIEHVAPKAWALSVQMARMNAWADLMQCAVALAVSSVVCGYLFALAQRHISVSRNCDEVWYVLRVLSFLACAAAVLACACNAVSDVVHLCSPEAFALQLLKS